jgi:hypothetical protein
MARFTVRVELHDVINEREEYGRLHEKMEQAGFRKYIETQDDESLALPTAEYRYFSSTETNKQVVEKAYKIAHAIRQKPSVISTEGEIAFLGLKKFQPPKRG